MITDRERTQNVIHFYSNALRGKEVKEDFYRIQVNDNKFITIRIGKTSVTVRAMSNTAKPKLLKEINFNFTERDMKGKIDSLTR